MSLEYQSFVDDHKVTLPCSFEIIASLLVIALHTLVIVAIFAGYEGHKDATIKSVDWHPLGKTFVSSGMDETIKIWSLDGHKVCKAMEDDKRQDGTCRTAYEQLPLFSTAMIHTNYGTLYLHWDR